MYRDLQIVLLVLYTLKTNEFAFLAQLAEHKICNFGVISSILIEGSILKKTLAFVVLRIRQWCYKCGINDASDVGRNISIPQKGN